MVVFLFSRCFLLGFFFAAERSLIRGQVSLHALFSMTARQQLVHLSDTELKKALRVFM